MIWMSTLNWMAAAILLVHCLCVLNCMHRHSNHAYRLAYVLLGVGAIAVLAGPIYGYTRPPTGEVLLNVGMAGVVLVGHFAKNRRAVP